MMVNRFPSNGPRMALPSKWFHRVPVCRSVMVNTSWNNPNTSKLRV